MSATGIITGGTRIVGKISAEGDLDVYGQVEGSIDASATVTIADGARVKSTVHGQRVIVSGAVAGDLSASDTLVLESSARVVGNISAPIIGIRPGALLRGRVDTAGRSVGASDTSGASAASGRSAEIGRASCRERV
jgi:cytoskeletal protein CcmA (bactofilin family)